MNLLYIMEGDTMPSEETQAKSTAEETPGTQAKKPETQTKEAEATQAQTAGTETSTSTNDVSKDELTKILRHHVWGAMGVGLIPVPIVDILALTGIQLNMLRKLAEFYGIPFFKDIAKNLLSSLLGSALPVAVAPGLAASLMKFIPVIGQTVGALTMPIVAGAATYAVGKVFIQHFASGGTFLTFEPEKVKAYYEEMFKEGREMASEMKKTQEEQENDKASKS